MSPEDQTLKIVEQHRELIALAISYVGEPEDIIGMERTGCTCSICRTYRYLKKENILDYTPGEKDASMKIQRQHRELVRLAILIINQPVIICQGRLCDCPDCQMTDYLKKENLLTDEEGGPNADPKS